MRTTPKKKISLERFLRTGNLDGFYFGANGTDLLECVGPPDDFGALPDNQTDQYILDLKTKETKRKPPRFTPRKMDARIWKYGDIEIYFSEPAKSLWHIQIEGFKGRPSGGKRFKIDPFGIKGGIKKYEIEVKLRRLNVPFVTESFYEDTVLKLGSGVKLIFPDSKPDWPYSELATISLTNKSFLDQHKEAELPNQSVQATAANAPVA